MHLEFLVTEAPKCAYRDGGAVGQGRIHCATGHALNGSDVEFGVLERVGACLQRCRIGKFRRTESFRESSRNPQERECLGHMSDVKKARESGSNE